MAVLVVFSIFGAFIGAENAAQFFASMHLAFFWTALAVMLSAGFVLLGSLRKKPGLLLSHLGCLLVILGSLWGSEQAHKLRSKYLKCDKAASGYMQIHEGHHSDSLVSSDGSSVLATLPFAIGLNDFWIEYYNTNSSLLVGVAGKQSVVIPAVIGEKIALANELSTLEITRVFRNFRIHIEDGLKTVRDIPGDGTNPALEIELTKTDGSTSRHYVFGEAMVGHGFSYEGLDLVYHHGGGGAAKDYKSSLSVLEAGNVVKSQVIEVNKPLRYGGYDFYQFSYDPDRGKYTVLSVVSNSGLGAVYAGYILLCAGIVWQCWLRHVPGCLRGRI